MGWLGWRSDASPGRLHTVYGDGEAISILWTFKLLLLIISSSFNVATGVGRSSYLCRPLSACRTFSCPVNDVAIASVS